MSVYVLSQGSSNISTLLLNCYVVKQKCSDSKDYSERWIETGEKETGEQQCLTEVIKSFNVNNTWNKELWGTMVIDINMAGRWGAMQGISSKPDVSGNKWKKAYFFTGMKTDGFLSLVHKECLR
ncbi:uncharacterized protein LOC110591792 [Neomonachus schauinslandi]|uniref:Uncharacterized protein LOC110591792 n=1 Tax=Neomonachus schauinslandi TaxID=29088 RepID=A0A2Y9I7Z4_NEOSC|nr:uncharacterized protein LOC110591792 [Neomonachus schauinslandi]